MKEINIIQGTKLIKIHQKIQMHDIYHIQKIHPLINRYEIVIQKMVMKQISDAYNISTFLKDFYK